MAIVKVYRKAGARLPSRATEGSAGYDVYARLEPDTYLLIQPHDRMAVPTGLYFEIPPEHCISLRPRSGFALKKGITLLNSPATIDSDYRGELQVLLINHGREPVRIEHGDRIAQLLIERVHPIDWEEVGSVSGLDSTPRGGGGFGSTGMTGFF